MVLKTLFRFRSRSHLKPSLSMVGSGTKPIFHWKELLSKKNHLEDVLSQIEDTLIEADLGHVHAGDFVKALRDLLHDQRELSEETLRSCMREVLETYFETCAVCPLSLEADKTSHALDVIVVMGVNGVGKTTCMAKMAYAARRSHKKITLGTADTYRAAAYDQLLAWSRRLDVPLIGGAHLKDGAAVAYDTVHSALAKKHDMCFIDTAGRLENKEPLMNQLRKLMHVILKFGESIRCIPLLVVDASLGLSSYRQAKVFSDVVPLQGLIVSKMDTDAKAGILLSIVREMKIPICFLGWGEQLEQLERFDKKAYFDRLLRPLDF